MLRASGGPSSYKTAYFPIYVSCKMLGGMELLVINPSADGISGTYPTFTGSDIKKTAESKRKMSMKTYFIPYRTERETYSLFDRPGNASYWFPAPYRCEWIFRLNPRPRSSLLSLLLGALARRRKDEA